MTMTFCQLPLPFVPVAPAASNDAHYFPETLPANVRLLRRAHDPDRTRFIMSGKLSDVCAALDRLVALEQRNACL